MVVATNGVLGGKKEMGGITKRLMAQNHKVFLSPLFILIDLKRKIIANQLMVDFLALVNGK